MPMMSGGRLVAGGSRRRRGLPSGHDWRTDVDQPRMGLTGAGGVHQRPPPSGRRPVLSLRARGRACYFPVDARPRGPNETLKKVEGRLRVLA